LVKKIGFGRGEIIVPDMAVSPQRADLHFKGKGTIKIPHILPALPELSFLCKIRTVWRAMPRKSVIFAEKN